MSSAARQAIRVSDLELADGCDLTRTYAEMLTIRRLEEKLGQLVALGVIAEPGALATGKEAVAVAISRAARPGEHLVSTICDNAMLLTRGVSLVDLLSCMIAGQDVAEIGASRSVGLASDTIRALSLALDLARRGLTTYCWVVADQTACTAISDCLAQSAAEQLPLVLVIETGMGDAKLEVDRSGLHVDRVDAIDTGRIATVCEEAAARARSGRGPTAVLARTERFLGHSGLAQRGSKELPREATDPVARCRARLLEEGLLSEPALKALERDIRERVGAAAAEARARIGAD